MFRRGFNKIDRASRRGKNEFKGFPFTCIQRDIPFLVKYGVPVVIVCPDIQRDIAESIFGGIAQIQFQDRSAALPDVERLPGGQTDCQRTLPGDCRGFKSLFCPRSSCEYKMCGIGVRNIVFFIEFQMFRIGRAPGGIAGKGDP